MLAFDPEKFLKEPIYAFNFEFMIGDIKDFLEFSESNIEWQFRRELQFIQQRAKIENFPEGYEQHLEENAEHRFKVCLPLQVRYGALIALTISVEWSVCSLIRQLKENLPKKHNNMNLTVHALNELCKRVGINKEDAILDYKILVKVRNCIAHNAGITENHKYRDEIYKNIDRLSGITIGNWHIFGEHICIERDALNPYFVEMRDLIVELHKTTHEKGFLHNGI